MACIHIFLQMPYRQMEGFTRQRATFLPALRSADYTTLFRRIQRMDIAVPLNTAMLSRVETNQILGGYRLWAEKANYGMRWEVEGLFSSVKRIFGESVRASSIEGMFREAQMKIRDISLYNQDDDMNLVESVKRLKDEIIAIQGLLFVTPEYNRSIPGVLKNAVDHASRPHALNAWAGKPAGVLGVSTGAIGTALGQQHLRNVLPHLDVPTLCQPEAFIRVRDGLFDEAGNIGADRKQFLQNWMDLYVAWVKMHAA